MDRNLATNFANTLAYEFIEASLEARWKMCERMGYFLSKPLTDMRNVLSTPRISSRKHACEAGLLFTNEDKNNISEEKLLHRAAVPFRRPDGKTTRCGLRLVGRRRNRRRGKSDPVQHPETRRGFQPPVSTTPCCMQLKEASLAASLTFAG